MMFDILHNSKIDVLDIVNRKLTLPAIVNVQSRSIQASTQYNEYFQLTVSLFIFNLLISHDAHMMKA